MRAGRVVLGLEPGGLDGVDHFHLTVDVTKPKARAASDVPRGLRSYRTGELEIGLGLSRCGLVVRYSYLVTSPARPLQRGCVGDHRAIIKRYRVIRIFPGQSKSFPTGQYLFSSHGLAERQTAARVLTIASQRSTRPCGEITCMLSLEGTCSLTVASLPACQLRAENVNRSKGVEGFRCGEIVLIRWVVWRLEYAYCRC